jgi:predicted permease
LPLVTCHFFTPVHDLRYALRTLARSPGFTAVAIATLAIAIGVNSAIFSLVNGLFLRPMVPSKPAEVVNIFTARQGPNRDYRSFSYEEYTALREANPVFRDVAALSFTLVGMGRDESLRRSFVFFVSDNFFSLLGVRPAAGRFFTAAESRPNAGSPVVIASYALWQRLGGRPDFVGSTIQVNGQPLTVIGITPRGFSGLNAVLAPDLWLPLGIYTLFSNPLTSDSPNNDLARPNTYALNLLGRLSPGVDVATAVPLLPPLARRLAALQPPEAATAAARELQIQPPSRFNLSNAPSADTPIALGAALMLGMAGVVLLIACLNLANMFLARGTTRAREIAIRLSLGAPRWRVVRQLLAEGLLLALAGGVLGLLLAQWSDDVLTQSLNAKFRALNFGLAFELQPDATVLGATLFFAVVATLIFSLGPALRSVRTNLVHDLKLQTGDAAVTGRWNRFFSARHCLVMAQISLSLVLLFSGGLFFHSALNASGLNLGFDPGGSAVAEFDFSLGRNSEAAVRAKLPALLAQLRERPEIRAAAIATQLPYTNVDSRRQIAPADAPVPSGPDAKQSGFDGIFCATTTEFFDVIGVRLIQGRTFTSIESESREAPPVAIVDARMARLLFPNGEALGRRIRFTSPPADGSPAEMEIVGIVSDHRHQPRSGEPDPHLYVPFPRGYSPGVYLTVRFATDNPGSVAVATAGLRTALRRFDPDLPVLRLAPFADLVERNLDLWLVRMGAVLFGTFGGIALLLAVVGVYGVKSYAVARRTREIGIRIALGAMPRDVFALIVKQGALQTAFAVLIGTGLSLLIGKVLASALFDVSPADPPILAASIGLLALSALLACYLPARRAIKVNPTDALRAE